jgi:hypothetical protein
MPTTDRFRFLRGLGLAVASLLVISGAVLASQPGLPSGEDRPGSEASESQHPSPSPSSPAVSAGELLDQLGRQASPDESESAEPVETPGAPETHEAEAGQSVRDHATTSPRASGSPEAQESEREHASGSPEATSSPDDHGGESGHGGSGPGGGDDDGHDDH